MKKAVVVVSFGTSHADAEESCIRPVEGAVAAAFPDRTFFRAWTSRIIIKKLAGQGIVTDTVDQALEKARQAGCDNILLVSTHIIPGQEYELLLEKAADCAVSAPLLSSAEDLDWMAGLLGGIAREEGRTLLVMGHGTEHAADEIYRRLRARLPENVQLACVEGANGLDTVLPGLEALADKAVTLMPLMLVAGDHAKNDLAGDDDSWKTRLEALGFDVRARLQGLGALEEVRQRFVRKAAAALNPTEN